MINSIVPIVSNSSCESVLVPQLRASFGVPSCQRRDAARLVALPRQPRTILAGSVITLAPLRAGGRDWEDRSDSRV
jgi:hypothetical protein